MDGFMLLQVECPLLVLTVPQHSPFCLAVLQLIPHCYKNSLINVMILA